MIFQRSKGKVQGQTKDEVILVTTFGYCLPVVWVLCVSLKELLEEIPEQLYLSDLSEGRTRSLNHPGLLGLTERD